MDEIRDVTEEEWKKNGKEILSQSPRNLYSMSEQDSSGGGRGSSLFVKKHPVADG